MFGFVAYGIVMVFYGTGSVGGANRSRNVSELSNILLNAQTAIVLFGPY